jgi:predicted nucleic acid-binding protein
MPSSREGPGSRVVLDTSVLIRHWHRSGPPADEKAARSAAEGLVRTQATGLILSVVYLEFVCGIGSRRELLLAEAFLAAFDVADGWEVRESDLREAHRLARRVPRDGRRRQLGDCLLRAMANRLRLSIRTLDSGFPRT